MRSCKLVFLFLLWQTSLFAQEPTAIASDRPGQAFSAVIVKPKHLQIQHGFSFSEYKEPVYKYLLLSQVSSTQLRLGLTNRIELNVSLGIRKNYFKPSFPSYNKSGLAELALGLRVRLNDENANFKQALQFSVNPSFLHSADFRNPKNQQFNLAYITSIPLPFKFSLASTLATHLETAETQLSYFYALNLSRSIGERFSVFIEHFNTLNATNNAPLFDFGCAYLLKPNLQLDVFAGRGKLNSGRDLTYFINLGFSYNFQYSINAKVYSH